MPKEDKVYKAVCHTKCYWLENLWEPGDVYEGTFEPNHHFSQDGKMDAPKPPPIPGDDPRSDKEIRKILKEKYSSTQSPNATRKQLWSALRNFENADSMDESTNPDTGKTAITLVAAKCGFLAKNKAGQIAHERQCDKCKEV